jgi:hypothetical protein
MLVLKEYKYNLVTSYTWVATTQSDSIEIQIMPSIQTSSAQDESARPKATGYASVQHPA